MHQLRYLPGDVPGYVRGESAGSLNQIVEKYWLKGTIAEGVPPEEFGDCTLRAAEGCCSEIIPIEESQDPLLR